MIYRKFRISIILRILVIVGLIFLLSFIVYNVKSELYSTSIIVIALIVYQIYSLLKYIDKTNFLLNNFLESIRYSDFSQNFQIKGLGSSFDKLQNNLNKVINEFQIIRAEKEEQYHYLQTIVHHIGIALIAFRRNGEIEVINDASKKLFQVKNIKNISELSSFSGDLVTTLQSLKHGENTLVKVIDNDDILQLSVYATEFKINDRSVIIASIKNIQYELEKQEIQSWQKLISVLTHEIMNSIAPISSLSDTLIFMINDFITGNKELFEHKKDNFEVMDEVKQAIGTINRRSNGLLHFVETYRNLTKIPKPNFSIFPVSNLLDSIHKLFKSEIEKSNIVFSVDVNPSSIELSADEQLIEQVIINIVKNAIQALGLIEGDKNIYISSYYNKRGRVCIKVADNGPGIMPDVLERIFIPFFTTKPKGSGIGLSLSKQIMRLHQGSITAKSEVGSGTTFILTF